MTRKHIKTKYVLAHPHNIMNLPAVRDWFGMPDGATETEKRFRFDRTMRMTSDNREELARIFGTRQQTFTSEFRYDVWRIEHDGLYFWVLSAKAKGTGIEIEMPEVWAADDQDKVIDFLEFLHSELKAIENETD